MMSYIWRYGPGEITDDDGSALDSQEKGIIYLT